MSLCRSSCIHSPLYYPTSTHKKLNLFLEIAFTLHNTHGMIASALILFLYRRGCHDPFQLSHSHCFSTSAHPSSKGRGSLGTCNTFTETTHSGELLDLSALHILAKLFSHMPMAGSGHGGESLKVYIQCMGVEGICKTESRPV